MGYVSSGLKLLDMMNQENQLNLLKGEKQDIYRAKLGIAGYKQAKRFSDKKGM
jgi:hypothetical protein